MLNLIPAATTRAPAPARVELNDAPHARLPRALSCMPGLFRYVDEKLRSKLRTGLQLTYTHGQRTFELRSASVLTARTLQVYLGVVALCEHGQRRAVAPQGRLDDADQALVKGLQAPAFELPAALQTETQPEGVSAAQSDAETLVATDFSRSNLLELLGWPVCGQKRAIVDAELKALASVVILEYPEGKPREFTRSYLLAEYRSNGQSAKWSRIHVAYCPQLTRIILGVTRQHTSIALADLRSVPNDPVAPILLHRISGWLDDGKRRDISVGTLLEYVWPSDPETQNIESSLRDMVPGYAKLSDTQVRDMRLVLLNTALKHMNTLAGWDIRLFHEWDYQPKDSLTNRENEREEAAYLERCAANQRNLRQDITKVLLWVKRPSIKFQLQYAT